ncbi:MAG: elongation factor G [Chloroflexi bacterium]|nr:elongation factor G [Chloroflexota bacterium]
MKEYSTDAIRNVALVSHGGVGKSTLVEAFLHVTGATTRMGKIEDGTTVSDFDEEEVRRGISLYTSIIPVEYKDCKINVLDTPGFLDFIGEVISGLRVADGAIVLIDSVSGVEVGTEITWQYCDKFNMPRIAVINKMERDNANFQKALASLQEFSSIRVIPIQLPWGEKQDFQGVIDLLQMKAYKGNSKDPVDIPAEYQDAAESARMTLIEAAAEGDDSLLEKYLETGELSDEEIRQGLRSVVRSRSFVPVMVASGQSEIGIFPLLDAITDLFPSPAEVGPAIATTRDGETELQPSDSGPLAAYVWKTTADPFVGKLTFFRVYSGTVNSDSRIWNQNKSIEERLGQVSVMRGKEAIPVRVIHTGDIGVVPKLAETTTGNTMSDRGNPITLPVPEYPGALYQVAVTPKTQIDSAKISPTLTRLTEEDPTLSWHNEPATGQTILQGMGDQHIDVVIRRAETKFQTSMLTEEPRVPYREAITKKGQAMYRHKKQTGGSGQFGEVHLRIEPLEETDFEFVNDVFGGAISSSYMPAIEKGIRNVMKEGILAGFPISNVKVSVFDGKEHPVDSKPIAFEIAGREAFKLAFHDAGPVLFEPIMLVQITVPEANMGDVMGDLNTRRARIQGMNTDRGISVVTAHVPLAEMLRYTTQLRSMTGGRGYFSMEFDHYEILPSHLAQEVIAARQREKKEE